MRVIACVLGIFAACGGAIYADWKLDCYPAILLVVIGLSVYIMGLMELHRLGEHKK